MNSAIRRSGKRGGAGGRHRKPWHASIPGASLSRAAALHCRVPGVVTCPSGAALLHCGPAASKSLWDQTQIIECVTGGSFGSDSIREEMASLAHDQWSGWMRYLFGKSHSNGDGTVTIPLWAVERWQRQMETDYANLSEVEKDSDRREADKIIARFLKAEASQNTLKIMTAIQDIIEARGQDCGNCGNWRNLVTERRDDGSHWHNSVAAGSPRIIEQCTNCGDEASDIYDLEDLPPEAFQEVE